MVGIDLASGIVGEPTSVRQLRDLAHCFAAASSDDDRVVYRTYGMSGDDTETPELRWATTVIEAGDVNGEPFMTRGHVHLDPRRGEWMMTLSGTGELRLKLPQDRSYRAEPLTAGSIHLIDGREAHRVVNTGSVPLVVIVVWLSDCGHDYDVDWT